MEISRFHGDFKISLKISGFPERLCKINFQISMKISARFLDFNEDICKISRSARFPDSSVDFDILILNFRMM